jgi:pyruvate/2-oxoglutarate dehydrogenase complex dihydrolipoamide acyltransferase (E2) component
VVAPAAGTVSFAGTVPTNGKSMTIETADGYSVTLTHLGSIGVVEGATVAEQDAIGTVGPSGTPEVDGPYVHLGIRLTADQNGYVDPLSLLPPAVVSGADQSGSTAVPPSSTGVASAPPVIKREPIRSTPVRPPVAAGRPAGTRRVSTHERGRAQQSRTDARPERSAQRPRVRETWAPLEVATTRSRPSARTGSIRRPFVEPAASGSRTAAPSAPPRPGSAVPVVGLVCNGVAALCAVGAAVTAGRRRRRSRAIPDAGAGVLRLPPPGAERRHLSRAA